MPGSVREYPLVMAAFNVVSHAACYTRKDSQMSQTALPRRITTPVWTAICLLCWMLGQPVHADEEIKKIHEVEGISEYRLENGLSVLLFPDPSKETVTVNVTYKVGSKHENYGETGMAHLLEHLLFKGSKNHPDIPAELSARGARPNGTTWIDRTNYYETFNATPENIDWALAMEADRMVNSFIRKSDLDSEMTVVRNEFERSENSPFRVLMQRMLGAAYMWHNNGKPTIGARSDIENVSIERLRAFYKTYYQPDNAVLTVAGRFDEQDMIRRVQKAFGDIPKPERELAELYTVEPPQDGEKAVTVRRVGDIQWYAASYHIPAGSHPEFAPIQVLTQVLGDTPRGRLHKNLVDIKLAVSAFAMPFQLQDPGVILLAAQVDKAGDLEKTRSAFLQSVEQVDAQPVTEEEVERAKRNLLKDIDMAFNSSERIAVLLSEYIGMGDWRLLFLNRDRIEQVTAEDVQRVAKKYLSPNNRTEGRFLPAESSQRVIIPQVPDVSAMLEGYTGREGVSAGEAFDPAYDNIDARTVTFSLPSGAQVSLLPKKTRGQSVVVRLNMQFGTEQSLQGLTATGETAGSMLMRGTSRYSRDDLQDRMDAIRTRLGATGDVRSAQASLETQAEHIVPAIQLLAHVLREPKFDEHEFELLRSAQLANLESSRQDPQAIVSRERWRFYSYFEPGHPKYVPTLDERIAALKELKVEDLRRFHQRFYGANNMQIAVVGEFDQQAVREALVEALGDWKSQEPYQHIEHPFKAIPPVEKTFNTPDKENAAIMAMLPVPVSDTDEVAPALRLGAYLFGGGFLNSRLTNRLRQQEGLSYSVSAWIGFSPLEPRAEFNATAIYAPQNMHAVEAGIREELQKMAEQGFSAEELVPAKSGMLQKSRVERSQDHSLAAQLAGNLFLQRTMQWDKQVEERLQALTAEEVNRAVKHYLKPEQLSFIKAGDLSKVPERPAAKR